MKCPYCGYENSEGTAICEMCEMPLQQLTRKRQHGRPETSQTQKADRPIRVHQLEEQFEIPCSTSQVKTLSGRTIRKMWDMNAVL